MFIFTMFKFAFEMHVHISNHKAQFLSCLSINVFWELVVVGIISSKLMYSCTFISRILLYCCCKLSHSLAFSFEILKLYTILKFQYYYFICTEKKFK
jgi:hypothetical protein